MVSLPVYVVQHDGFPVRLTRDYSREEKEE